MDAAYGCQKFLDFQGQNAKCKKKLATPDKKPSCLVACFLFLFFFGLQERSTRDAGDPLEHLGKGWTLGLVGRAVDVVGGRGGCAWVKIGPLTPESAPKHPCKARLSQNEGTTTPSPKRFSTQGVCLNSCTDVGSNSGF